MRCEDFSIHFLEIHIQNISILYPKAVILDGGFPLKKAVTHVRSVKVTLYVYENLTFRLTKSRRVNFQQTLRLKTISLLLYGYMVGNINKAKMDALAERDLSLIYPKRQKKREKKT